MTPAVVAEIAKAQHPLDDVDTLDQAWFDDEFISIVRRCFAGTATALALPTRLTPPPAVEGRAPERSSVRRLESVARIRSPPTHR